MKIAEWISNFLFATLGVVCFAVLWIACFHLVACDDDSHVMFPADLPDAGPILDAASQGPFEFACDKETTDYTFYPDGVTIVVTRFYASWNPDAVGGYFARATLCDHRCIGLGCDGTCPIGVTCQHIGYEPPTVAVCTGPMPVSFSYEADVFLYCGAKINVSYALSPQEDFAAGAWYTQAVVVAP